MDEFKVGDKVQRNDYRYDQSIRIVTEVSPSGWFNHDGGVGHEDYAEGGGCCVDYWHLVEASPTSRTNDPATSKGSRKVNKYEQAVLTVLAGAHHTGKEIAAVSGQPLNFITPRFAPLRRKGLIKDSGVRRDKQIVWALV